MKGLSPRLRGNALIAAHDKSDPGSIPALAGERFDPFRRGIKKRVYPRACGGTDRVQQFAPDALGLSPRLRGNDDVNPNFNTFRGSIPALAGERWLMGASLCAIWVYPRACGGTHKHTAGFLCTQGLSPRLRGNDGFRHSFADHVRSIPALAGERFLPHFALIY